jgi:hypothetical protein
MDLIHRCRVFVIPRNFAGEMENRRYILDRRLHVIRLRHRANCRLDTRIGHPLRNRRCHNAQILLTGIKHLTNDMRPEESGTPGDEDLLFDFRDCFLLGHINNRSVPPAGSGWVGGICEEPTRYRRWY